MKSLSKAFSILEFLAEHKDPLTLSDISDPLKVNKSTARRFLMSLIDLGYVRQDPDTRFYSLSDKLANLGKQVQHEPSLQMLAKSYLEYLAIETGETVNLGVLLNQEVLYIDKRESTHQLRYCVEVGGVAPIHATALGKAIIAFVPAAKIKKYISRTNPLPQFTPHTIVEWGEFERELRRVREEGIAWDEEEHMQGGFCVGAPVFSGSNVIAAISISSPISRMTPERKELYKELLIDQSRKLSQILTLTNYSSLPVLPGE